MLKCPSRTAAAIGTPWRWPRPQPRAHQHDGAAQSCAPTPPAAPVASRADPAAPPTWPAPARAPLMPADSMAGRAQGVVLTFNDLPCKTVDCPCMFPGQFESRWEAEHCASSMALARPGHDLSVGADHDKYDCHSTDDRIWQLSAIPPVRYSPVRRRWLLVQQSPAGLSS